MNCTLVLLPGMDGTGGWHVWVRALRVVCQQPTEDSERAAPSHRARYFQPGSPGLYLRATGDRLVTKAAAEAFAKAAVNARVVDIEGPHLLLQTNPIETARVLRAFIHEASADHSENR